MLCVTLWTANKKSLTIQCEYNHRKPKFVLKKREEKEVRPALHPELVDV